MRCSICIGSYSERTFIHLGEKDFVLINANDARHVPEYRVLEYDTDRNTWDKSLAKDKTTKKQSKKHRTRDAMSIGHEQSISNFALCASRSAAIFALHGASAKRKNPGRRGLRSARFVVLFFLIWVSVLILLLLLLLLLRFGCVLSFCFFSTSSLIPTAWFRESRALPPLSLTQLARK